ncbi:ADP-heptose--LPS heptosyltransferase [Achromobacter xylosoxidans]|uniref:glycosyltransferase family 9 protein n=1 Tax=Alcaligenes xylosoxydans xylosoxydans TaxID=85698 RepID=UPI00064D7F0A|nr:glycosyltransferase family 9 protein [Achromobacter xylosoxidans]KMJ92229.1 ADP-heptose--LPS heptosyltransferase [Achromobacter xylosoxidans]
MTAALLATPPANRIAVFRALQLGDMLCAVPALRALRQAFPQARISLIGLAGAREFVARFHAYVDELIEFPGIAEFPEQACRPDELPAFFRRVRAARPDVALQMHGSGVHSNRIVSQLGAARWGGFVADAGAQIEGRRLCWPDDLPEPQRYLALLRFLGLPATDDRLEFPCGDEDAAAARALLRRHGLDPARLVLMHPGARLRSRRWPLARYAEVARALRGAGWQVALTGSDAERALTRELRQRAGLALPDLCGATTLGSLAALLRASRLLVCNDTGVSHLAAAMGARSVVIACGSDARRWAPRDSRRHVVLAAPVPCRPCAYESCPIGHPCALRVTVADVLARSQEQLARGLP